MKSYSDKHFLARYFRYNNGWSLEVIGEAGKSLRENKKVRIRILDSKGQGMAPGKAGESQHWLINALLYDLPWLEEVIFVDPSEALWLHDQLSSYANLPWYERVGERIHDMYRYLRRLRA